MQIILLPQQIQIYKHWLLWKSLHMLMEPVWTCVTVFSGNFLSNLSVKAK